MEQAYTAGGSFAEYALSQAQKTVKLPEEVSTREAATVLLQGLTGTSPALSFSFSNPDVPKQLSPSSRRHTKSSPASSYLFKPPPADSASSSSSCSSPLPLPSPLFSDALAAQSTTVPT